MAPSFSCLFLGCSGSSKHPPSPDGEPPRPAEPAVLSEIPIRHITPAQTLPPLDIEFYTPTHPFRDSVSAELPPSPALRPVKLPSIADETTRRTSWRLSYASDRRASHLRSLSGQEHKRSESLSQEQRPAPPISGGIHLVTSNPLYEQPTVAPLRSWLHSQGLRIPSEAIDDNSSEDDSGSPSPKKLSKRKALSYEELCAEKEDFGGVDGSGERTPILHLHEMGISQRLASRGLVSSTSSPQLSACGSHFGGGHKRGVSGVSSAAGSRYSRYSNISPYSARSKYYNPKSNAGSKKSQNDSVAPFSVHPRHEEQPKEDSSKSGKHSSDQSDFDNLDIPGAWGAVATDVDGSSSIYHTPKEGKPSPFAVPSRSSSARNSPQDGSRYKIDQILHTGMSQHSLENDGRPNDADRIGPDEKDRVDFEMLLPDGIVSENSTFPRRSSKADAMTTTNMIAAPLKSSTITLDTPIVKWMGIHSTLDETLPTETDTQSFNEREFSLKRVTRHPTPNDSSLLASETESFMEREKQLMEIQKRFTMWSKRGPKQPVKSKFREEFGRPSLSFHRSLSRPHSLLSKIRFPKRKTSPKFDNQNFDGASLLESFDGAEDSNSTETAPSPTPALRGPPRGPRAGGPAGGKAPKVAPVMAPAMAPAIGPTKGQKKKAMRQKLASWEDELAAVEKAAREKSKGVAPPKRIRVRDGWDPIKWSSFPSHDRYERTESAGAVDRVDQQDFAIKARTPSGNVAEWKVSERKTPLQDYNELNDSDQPLTLREKITLALHLKIRATGARFETDASNGRRSSISAGGDLEFPELEIVGGTESSGDYEAMEAEVEEALRIEEEMKANEKKRQEAAARRALLAPPPTDGSFDGSFRSWAQRERVIDQERLLSGSIHIANPQFYDDCVAAPMAERGREWLDDNGNDASSSIHSARTTGSMQLEMEMGKGKRKEMVSITGELGSKDKKEKYGTWNGRDVGKKSTVETVYGVKTKKIMVGHGDGVSVGDGNNEMEGVLRRSTVDFERDVEIGARLEMERVLNAAKAAWGVKSVG